MRKLKVIGQILDDKEEPIYNIKLKAIIGQHPDYKDFITLGNAKTDKKGKFEINHIFNQEIIENNYQIKIEILIDDKVLMNVSKDLKDDFVDFKSIKYDKGNIGVNGRIIDEKGDPIEGLTVIAEDVDYGKMELNVLNLVGSKIKSFIKDEGILGDSLDNINTAYHYLLPLRDDYLGSIVTDKNGYYQIIYPPERYNDILEKKPDLRIIVKDKLGVFELVKTNIYENISNTIENIEDIVINRGEIEGWQVTLNSNYPSRLTQNNNFEILIDNFKALNKIVNVIEDAKSYIYLTQFEFYPDFIPRFFFTSKNYKNDDTLVYKLLDAQKRGADVKIIINENRIVPDNYDELYDYFKDSDVQVRRFPAKGPYSMHAKVLVVDGLKGFIIGSPFNQSYWDTDKHDVNEPRRLNKNEGPLHDVSMYLEGPAIYNLEEFFIELWNYLSNLHFNGENKITKNNSIISKSKYYKENKSNLRFHNEPLQIVRSITPKTITSKGEAGVLEAYRKAINNAEDFIYLENQYFTNKYIIGALKKVIELKPDLQIIMVINEVPDVPTYRHWQHYGLEFMGLDFKKLIIEHPRIGVFAKWSGKFQNGKNKLRNCYIHSKVAIIDDVWATVGTSNLDGSSLSCAEEFGSSDISINHRNMEMNALLFDENIHKKGTIKYFRKILWGEHLEMDLSNFNRPEKGWLELWKSKGYENVNKLEKEEIILYGGVLPYSIGKNAKEQINDLREKYRRIKGRFNR